MLSNETTFYKSSFLRLTQVYFAVVPQNKHYIFTENVEVENSKNMRRLYFLKAENNRSYFRAFN